MRSQAPVVVGESFYYTKLSQQLLVAEDKSKDLQLSSALKLIYSPVVQSQPNFGFSNSSYWFKGTLVNPDYQWKTLALQVNNPNIDIVGLYVFSKQTGQHKKLTGDLAPFKNRGNTNRYYHFNIQLLPKDTVQLVLNVQNSGEQFHVPIVLGTPAYFEEANSNEQLLYGVYFGFILFVLLLNGFFYYILKNTTSLLYIGYLFCLLFLQLSLTGFGFKYFWPDSVFLANHGNPIFASSSMFFLLLFSQQFLNIKQYLPKFNKVIIFIKYYLLAVMILSWINVHWIYLFSVISINVLSVILIALIVPVSFYIRNQKFKPARFFITAFMFLIISVLMFVLKNAGFIPSNIFTNFGLQIGSALEVLLLTLAVIDRFNEFKTDALTKSEELSFMRSKLNTELELKVEERTEQFNKQTQEIRSSIRYARRIQDSLLPSEEDLKDLFDENYFVYYKPKDIVSGDFYWASPVTTSTDTPHRLSLAAVVDCTGHGVPGAFLSIVANNFLKQSLKEKDVNNTAEALDFLNQKITSTLNRNMRSSVRVNDGMDLSLVAIDYEKHKLYYSGANNPVYIVRRLDQEPELTILKPTKQGIGYAVENIQPYDVQTFNILAGDTIYLFTDGFADQFGGSNDKKLNYKRFKEILVQASEMPIALQKNFLENNFENWRGTTEQTDDVCVMGIKI